MRRFALLVGIALATASCTNEIDQSTRPDVVAGTYTLVSYGGALPATIGTDASGTAQVVAGELVMSNDRTWVQTFTVSVTNGAASQTFLTSSEGTWAIIREQAYVNFNDKTNGYQFSGVAAGGQVTMYTQSGRQVIYRR
jgi:hypothetical protein